MGTEVNRDEHAPEAIVFEKKKKIKKYLGIGSIGIAGIFLFFPDIAVFDLLPDFIGYIILLRGISQLRDLNDYFGTAYDRFYKIAWISVLKYLSFFIVLGVFSLEQQPNGMLLVTFVFGLFDLIYLLPAWTNLFDGFSYLMERCDGTTFDRHGLKSENKRGRIERTRRMTMFFVGFKAIFTVLPEFSALTNDTEISTVFRLYDFIGILRAGAMLAVLTVGIIFLVRLFGFTRAAKRDSVLISFWREKYRTEVLTKEHIFIRRHLQSALFLASIAMVFRVDFRLEYLDIIPDALIAGFLVIAVLILGEHVGKRQRFWVVSAIFAVTSLVANFFEAYFSYYYSPTSITTDVEAEQLYNYLQILKIAEQALFVLMMLFFFLLMRNVIHSYTGFSVTPIETREPSDKIKAIHKELETGLKYSFLLTLVTAVSKIAMISLLVYRRIGLELDWLPLLDGAIAAVFAFFVIRTIRSIYSQVEYRFMLL